MAEVKGEGNGEVEVRISESVAGLSFTLWAVVGDRTVGWLKAVEISQDEMLLGSVEVANEVSSFSVWPLRGLFRRSFRRQGIGTKLLQRFLRHCDSREIAEVFGTVTDHDAKMNPKLIQWYERFGFNVGHGDRRQIGTEGCLIVRRRPGSGTT